MLMPGLLPWSKRAAELANKMQEQDNRLRILGFSDQDRRDLVSYTNTTAPDAITIADQLLYWGVAPEDTTTIILGHAPDILRLAVAITDSSDWKSWKIPPDVRAQADITRKFLP